MTEESPLPTHARDNAGIRPVRGQNADYVHARLRADILSLSVAPGEELDETILSSRYEVSRTPVREALIRLASEKLVVLSRNRRATVQPLDLASFPGYLEALDLLQRAVTRLAAERRTDADLTGIRDAQERYDGELAGPASLASVEANVTFHHAVATAARSAHLADAYRRILVEGMRFMALSFSVHDTDDEGYKIHMHSVNDEHNAIIAAIEARDGDRAEGLAHDHVALFRRRISAYLEREGTAGVSVVGVRGRDWTE